MPKQRIYEDRLYAHFVTFSCYHRRRLLDNDAARKITLGVLNRQLLKHDARLIGFVLMPDHVHAILWFSEIGLLPSFMKVWKQQSSRAIRSNVMPRLASYAATVTDDDPFWQRRYYAFQIYEPHKLQEKLDYMHLNPVRAGLVNLAVEWLWSSAPYYVSGRTVGVPISPME